MGNKEYFEALKSKADGFAHKVYRITRKFPKEELYGLTSQLRRASLSVVLNCIEGYARNNPGKKDKSYGYFLEIAYGSLKESEYLLEFSLKEGCLSKSDHEDATKLAGEIGGMIWGAMKSLGYR